MDFKRAEPTCYRINFPYTSSGWQNNALLYKVLRVMCLTYVYSMLDSILELCRAFPNGESLCSILEGVLHVVV